MVLVSQVMHDSATYFELGIKVTSSTHQQSAGALCLTPLLLPLLAQATKQRVDACCDALHAHTVV